jgi:glycosyltransferase involved in cell wall biosynthesis/SAM-dependent methyltransferase
MVMETYATPNCKVVLVGAPFIPIGLGEHLRYSVRAFQSVGVKIAVRDIYGMKYDDPDMEKEIGRYVVQDLSPDINVFYVNGDMVEHSLEQVRADLLASAYNIIYPMWELSRYPTDWAKLLDKFDEIWAPSQFTHQSMKSAVSKTVLHMPVAGEISLSTFLGRQYFGIPESSFACLFFFDFTSYMERKNPFAVLQAFEDLCRYCPNEDLCLVIKVKGGETRTKDYAVFSDLVARSKSRLLVIDKVLSDNEIKNLLRCCDCFVSLHRSEGVGLGLSAAMFMRKPVIATGYSGNLDFMTEDNSCLVRYDLCAVPEGAYPFSEGQVWAEPDIAHAVDHMLRLVTYRDYARELGERASRDIRVNFSYRATGLRYLDRIRKIVWTSYNRQPRLGASDKLGTGMCADDRVKGNLLPVLAKLNDEEWLEVLIRSINEPVVHGMELPRFPPDELQRQFGGSAGEHTLREAFNFYRVIKCYASRLGRPLTYDSRILDFGCGWGRISRFFLKEVGADNLYGIDVDPSVIEICKTTFSYGNYTVVDPYPPSEFHSESIDLIYAYSVFSHLAEPIHIKWVEEFSRILKPGGLLIVSTQGRSFIEFCGSLRGQESYDHPWYEALARSFIDTNAALKAYDTGEFLYSPTGGGNARPSTVYGEAVIPRAYIEREWTKFLVFRDFIDDRGFLPQALVVLQKALS